MNQKLLSLTGLLIALVLSLLFCSRQKAPDPLCNPIVTMLDGDCFLYQPGRQMLVKTRMQIVSGDTLVSAYNGKMKVTFNDSDYVVLNHNSKAVVVYDEMRNVEVTILHGKVYANVVILPQKGSFKTQTVKISTFVKGTAYTVEVDSEETVVQVLEGKVDVTDRDSLCPIMVRAGERAVVNPGRFPCRIERTSLQELKALVDWVGKSLVRLRKVSNIAQNPAYVRNLAQLDLLPPQIYNDPVMHNIILNEEEEKPVLRERPDNPSTLEKADVRTSDKPKSLVLQKRDPSEEALRSPEQIQNVINGSLIPVVNTLYSRHLRRERDFEGRILVRFTILPNGRVVNPTIVSSTTQMPDFDELVKSHVCDLRFGAVRTLGEMSIVYPFDFRLQ